MASLTPIDRIFVKRTRRGTVKTHVRQSYLRDDLPTGSPHLDELELEPKLQGERYLVLDTNVVLHQIDLLERPALRDVIILQTVLDEVRHNKISVHKRLRALVDDESRRFHVFSNEFHRDTYTARTQGESPNDRNDRAIRTAASWYQAQLGDQVQVLLLTNDAENLRKALEEGLAAQRIHPFVKSLPNGAELQELLAAAPEEATGGAADGAGGARTARAQAYPAHLPMSELTHGVQAGELHQGKLRINRHNSSRGAVVVRSVEGHSEVLIRGRMAMNRAVDADTVVVRLLPKEEWAGNERLAERGHAAKSAGGDEDEDDIGSAAAGGAQVVDGDCRGAEASWEDPGGKSAENVRPCAEVVGVVKRGWRPYVAVLDAESAMGSQYLAEPLDCKIPRINITTRQPDVLIGKLIIVVIDFWEAAHRYPTGHYVRTLGDVGDTAAESEAILHEHEVNSSPFSPQVQACLPQKGWQIPEEEAARRLDLRGGKALICSVDPPGCVDIDDALHARDLGNGRFEVGVHIADVGHFIKAGTAIDLEAAARGTTVYLVNRRIDMVPKRLGEDLCSLHGGVDRLAFSCIWEMDSDATIYSTRFVKTVICSEAALSYGEAQLRMDDPKQDDPLTNSLRTLNSLAKHLKAKRNSAGALTLGSPEVRFVLDSETSDPTDVAQYQLKEANSMVEEFMLLANISVAAEITRAFPQCAMLRRHPAPTPGSFDSLQRSLAQHGLSLDASSSLALTQSLDACQKADDPYFNKLTRILATRSMQQARYFCSGTLSPNDYQHYGLACPIYTHFTSPIRRYSDQVVHRLLAAVTGWESVGPTTLDPDAAAELCDNLNLRHTMAQYAGRASVSLHTLIFFRKRDVTETAYVIKVRENGVVVLVPRYGIEGLVFVCEAGERNPFSYDAKTETLAAPGCRLCTFDKVKVRISVDARKAHRPKLELTIIEPVMPTV